MFYLAPHPKLDRPRRGSPLMFTVPWVEKYLSRVRPWHVIAIWVPVALYMLYLGSSQTGPLAAAGCVAAGAFSWTFLEYLLHRWVFHFQLQDGHWLIKDWLAEESPRSYAVPGAPRDSTGGHRP